jgi:uncharacterized membrane protein YphA (DoxX/SURF4 family)
VGLALLGVRWLIAGIFLRSGVVKLGGLAEFRVAVANYRLLPVAAVPMVATVLPAAEVVLAVMLAAGLLPVAASAVLAALLVVFAVAVAINLARGRSFDCGCGGSVAPALISWRHVLLDLVLAAGAAAVAIAPPPAAQLWRGPAGLVRVTATASGAWPVLLAVIICLTMLTVLKRAVEIRQLAAAARPGRAHASPSALTGGH